MNKRLEKGSSAFEGIIALAVLLIILFFFILPDRSPDFSGVASSRTESTISSDTRNGVNGQDNNVRYEKTSSYQSISLGTGNASYAYQPYEEYITLANNGRTAVKVSGWKLTNAKSARPYELGGVLRQLPNDVVTIPRAAAFISPVGTSALYDVVLAPGESAVITSGSIGPRSPYAITSFKENICSGYLGTMSEYAFNPSLARNCPLPAREPGLDRYPVECQEFVERLPSCRIPEFDTKDRNGDICNNCVNGQVLPSSCVAFIKERLNYAGCIANHRNDQNFSGRTWRIFLGHDWELWAKSRETISLFDSAGRLVDYKSY